MENENLKVTTVTQKLKRSNILLIVFVVILFVVVLGLSITLLKTQSIITSNEKTVNKLSSSITTKEKKITEYIDKIQKYEKQVNFMNNHIVICPLDGSNLYHKYGCTHFNWSQSFSFMAFNIGQAPNEGFSPCYYCSTLNNNIDKKTEIVYVANTGFKYHKGNCSYLKSRNAITKEQAIQQGYSACSRCNP